jgi:uncharacterized protein DUF3572
MAAIVAERALPVSISQSYAETVGLKALTFLAGSPDAFGRFLTLSGIDSDSLRQRAGEPECLAAVLEFLLGNEELLTQFCEGESVDARTVHLASVRLGG